MDISWEKMHPVDNLHQWQLDVLSIPNYVIKKGRAHGARHGKTEAQKEHFTAHNARKRCMIKGLKGIHDRFQKNLRYRDAQLKADLLAICDLVPCFVRWMVVSTTTRPVRVMNGLFLTWIVVCIMGLLLAREANVVHLWLPAWATTTCTLWSLNNNTKQQLAATLTATLTTTLTQTLTSTTSTRKARSVYWSFWQISRRASSAVKALTMTLRRRRQQTTTRTTATTTTAESVAATAATISSNNNHYLSTLLESDDNNNSNNNNNTKQPTTTNSKGCARSNFFSSRSSWSSALSHSTVGNNSCCSAAVCLVNYIFCVSRAPSVSPSYHFIPRLF